MALWGDWDRHIEWTALFVHRETNVRHRPLQIKASFLTTYQLLRLHNVGDRLITTKHCCNNDNGKTKGLRGYACPSVVPATTNSKWVVLGLRWGIRGQRPATDHLSHGTSDYSYLSLKSAAKLITIITVHSVEHNSFIQYQLNMFRPNGPSSDCQEWKNKCTV